MQRPLPDAPHHDLVAAAVAAHGLSLRGGFAPSAADAVPAVSPGTGTATILMVGNLGPEMWPHVAPHIDGGRHPLDRWTRAVIEPIAARFGARAVFPFDEPPLPFQRWAKRAEGLSSSPVGVLIHPEYGLWHAYRAALLFPVAVEGVPVADAAPSPCESCEDKPCLSACPVAAFSPAGYDVPACAGHLASAAGAPCHAHGCRARDACPVGRAHRYGEDQIRFHMRAFSRAIVPPGRL